MQMNSNVRGDQKTSTQHVETSPYENHADNFGLCACGFFSSFGRPLLHVPFGLRGRMKNSDLPYPNGTAVHHSRKRWSDSRSFGSACTFDAQGTALYFGKSSHVGEGAPLIDFCFPLHGSESIEYARVSERTTALPTAPSSLSFFSAIN